MTRLSAIALAVVSLALVASLVPDTVFGQAALEPGDGGCEIVVEFFNRGTPMVPGEGPDPRFGVRLNVEGTAYAILPADREGRVRFYGATGRPVTYRFVPLYLAYSYTDSDYGSPGIGLGDRLAHCGLNRVETHAGS